MRKSLEKQTTHNFADVIRKKLDDDPDLAARVEREAFHADLASEIYEARKSAKLSQQELARRAGTAQSVISRIESADYDGHSINLLRRIAKAMDRRLRIGFYE